MSDLAWVPQSCTLPTEERSLRVAEWDALFSEHLRFLSRPQPLHLRLDLAGGPSVEDRVRNLVERESGCCSFFTFTTTPGEDLVQLDISVDEPHAAVLDALAVVLAVLAAGTWWLGRRRRPCSCSQETAGEGACGCQASKNPLEITGKGRR
ncbi:hypothetical protein ACFXAE_26705 [Streptomyces sp. NPDC059454]|uniref:hypothetical protein n=1 Tax=Streptomyces sp. NPDC059454 TaxID=3346836 RepID=UPI0036AE7408